MVPLNDQYLNQTKNHTGQYEAPNYLHQTGNVDRSTPLQSVFFPSELLMSRKLCTTVSMTRCQRMTAVPDKNSLKEKNQIQIVAKFRSTLWSRRDSIKKNEGDIVLDSQSETEAVVGEEVAPLSYKNSNFLQRWSSGGKFVCYTCIMVSIL